MALDVILVLSLSQKIVITRESTVRISPTFIISLSTLITASFWLQIYPDTRLATHGLPLAHNLISLNRQISYRASHLLGQWYFLSQLIWRFTRTF
jgi:hypothetical protein